jgi:hypothetical protein
MKIFKFGFLLIVFDMSDINRKLLIIDALKSISLCHQYRIVYIIIMFIYLKYNVIIVFI